MTSEDRGSLFDDREPRSSAVEESLPGERPRFTLWQEIALLLAVALILAVCVKAFLVQAFYIPSESMEPGLVENDRILVEKPSYWLGGEPSRGDVVVFKDPGGWLDSVDLESENPITSLLTKVGLFPSGGHLVKRVIGVEGDVIECCDDQGRISVNGVWLDELDYARPLTRGCDQESEGVCFGPMPRVASWKAGPVPADMLFVMGDNRNHSADSSHHLCTEAETDCSDSPWVPVGNVAGKVRAVIWPFSRASWDSRPQTFAGVTP